MSSWDLLLNGIQDLISKELDIIGESNVVDNKYDENEQKVLNKLQPFFTDPLFNKIYPHCFGIVYIQRLQNK